jgi:predicted ferric reductase
MVGTYGIVITLFLIARIPWLEREVGLDKTVWWHRKIAPYALFLVLGHVIFILLGYAMTAQTSLLAEFWDLIRHTRWILPATAGFVLFMMAGITSYKRARSRMSYETWWVIHLYTYLAVALSYAHQVLLGNAFINRPLAAKLWLAFTLTAVGSILIFRWILPLVRGVRYQLRVHAVVQEGPGVVSVWLKGRNLKKLNVSGGQFFSWRFMTRELWWHAHPYSLSAPPNDNFLRITVKDLGDHSAALAYVQPGTRVIAEGPYGAFTALRRHGDRVVLIAAGVGITPIRAVLEELPPLAQVDVLYRARQEEDIVLKRELDVLSQRPNTNIKYLVGNRKDHPMDARTLIRLAPHIKNSDVFICGPDAMTKSIRHAVEVIGVPQSHIHDEAFAF